MNRVYLATIRDIWKNKSRSFVVVLALIMVVCFPLAFLNVAPNLTTIIETEEETYHLAHFNIFLDQFYQDHIVDNATKHITEFLEIESDQVVVEPRVFQGTKIKSSGKGSLDPNTWIDLDIMAIDVQNLPYISSLEITSGRLPENYNEIIILDSLAKADGLSLGNVVTLYDQTGKVDFQIVGFVKSIEYSAYELSQTGVVFVSYDGMERLIYRVGLTELANVLSIYFEFDIPLNDLQDLSEYLTDKLREDNINAVLIWFTRETSFRRILLDALNLTTQYMTAASIFIFLVAGVVIFVVTNRYVTEQKKRIGAIYAFGVNRRQIIFSFFLRVFVLSIFAVILGLIIALFLLQMIVRELVEQWGLIGFSSEINSQSLIFTLTSAVIVSYLFTLLAVTNLIQLTPYEAMRGKTTELKSRGILFRISSVLPTKILRGAAKNLTRNRTRTVLTIVALTIALTFSGSLIYTDQSLDHTVVQFYNDHVYFDVEVELGFDIIGIPNSQIVEDLTTREEVKRREYFANSLVPLADRPDILTYMLAIQRNSTMYDLSPENVISGRWFDKNSPEVVISKYLESNTNFTLNSEISFNFFGAPVNVTVVGVTNDILFSSAIFIDFDYVNNVINSIVNPVTNFQQIIANKLLIQLHDGFSVTEFQNDLNENNINVNIAQTQFSYESRSIALTESQTAIIIVMVVLGLIVGVVSVFTTLLIAVIERERELALLIVFGYRKYELLIQILFEGWIIGVISLIPAFIFARMTSIYLWMDIISTNIYQVTPYFPWITAIFLVIFSIVSIAISIIPAFKSATSGKISETIREE